MLKFISMKERWAKIESGIRHVLRGGSPAEIITPPVIPEIDIVKLRERYNMFRLHVVNFQRDEPILVKALHEAGSTLIATVPDQIQQGILRSMHKYGLDLEDIFKAQDKGDWTESVRSRCRAVSVSLDGSRELYRHSITDPEPLPYTGENMLIWLLSLAKQDSTVSPMASIKKGVYASINEGVFCGKTFEELNINIRDVSGFLLLTTTGIMFSKDYSFLVDFVATVPSGEEWLKGIILESAQSGDKS